MWEQNTAVAQLLEHGPDALILDSFPLLYYPVSITCWFSPLKADHGQVNCTECHK